MAESSEIIAFHKMLREVAGQLWSSQLSATLESEHLRFLSEEEKQTIKSYEVLFDLLVQKQKISINDLSLLSVILKQQSQFHLDLLRPFYEAGFGHHGLERGGKQADTDGPVSRRRTSALHGKDKIDGALKARAACCETRYKNMLRRIGTNVNSEELSALKLLCQDAITRRQIESCPTGLDLVAALCKKQCITGKRPQFLYRLLQDCGRQDLTAHIDEYIYVCMMKPKGSHHQAANDIADEEIDLKRLLKRDRRSQGKNYLFRKSLKTLGDNLDQSDLQSMQYISTIPEGKLEKVKNVFDFFLLLEEMGKLSRGDLSFLEEVLDDKVHLLLPLYQKGFGQPKTNKVPSSDRLMLSTIFGTNPEMNFKRLIKTIGVRLTSDNVSSLKFMCHISEIGCLENVESGMELLACLEKAQKISPADIEFLAENLDAIGRKDLRKYLTLYRHSTPRNSLTPATPVSPIVTMVPEGFEPTDDEDQDATDEIDHKDIIQQLKEQVKEKAFVLQAEKEKHQLELELQKSKQECLMLKKQHECELLKQKLEMSTQENSNLRVRLAKIEQGTNGHRDLKCNTINEYSTFHV